MSHVIALSTSVDGSPHTTIRCRHVQGVEPLDPHQGDFRPCVSARSRSTVNAVVISAALRLRRRNVGISQSEFARRVGVNQQTVSRWENGTTPKPRHFEAIAEALDLTIAELFDLAGYRSTGQIEIHAVVNQLSKWNDDELWSLLEHVMSELRSR